MNLGNIILLVHIATVNCIEGERISKCNNICVSLVLGPPTDVKWELIHRHDLQGGLYNISEFDKNLGDPEAYLYSNLNVSLFNQLIFL